MNIFIKIIQQNNMEMLFYDVELSLLVWRCIYYILGEKRIDIGYNLTSIKIANICVHRKGRESNTLSIYVFLFCLSLFPELFLRNMYYICNEK